MKKEREHVAGEEAKQSTTTSCDASASLFGHDFTSLSKLYEFLFVGSNFSTYTSAYVHATFLRPNSLGISTLQPALIFFLPIWSHSFGVASGGLQ